MFAVGSGRAFAGLRNDPFFFDFEGFSALLNTFATPGQNVDAWHRVLLNLNFRGSPSGLFAPDERVLRFNVAGASGFSVFAQYFRTGVWHVWTGWDHMLFLAGLFLPAVVRRRRGEWQPAASLKVAVTDTAITVTAFTLAHALTLSPAATGFFSPPTAGLNPGSRQGTCLRASTILCRR